MNMKKIAFLGECMIELRGQPFGAMEQAFGGDSLNSALYLARIKQTLHNSDLAVFYATAMGCDALSQGIVSRWHDEGINTDLVLNDPNRQPGLYLIQLDDKGERTFLYWRNDSAARYLMQHPEIDRVLAALTTMDAIYLSGISLAILPPADRTRLIHELKRCKQQGKKIFFDSNFRLALWESIEAAQTCYQELLSITTVALVTDEDESLIWGDLDADATLMRLQTMGVAEIVLKQGKAGCRYLNCHTGETAMIPTTPLRHVVDTTSAGDSFNAGFIYGYLSGATIVTAAQMGNQLAGTVIAHQGAIIPTHYTSQTIKQFPAI